LPITICQPIFRNKPLFLGVLGKTDRSRGEQQKDESQPQQESNGTSPLQPLFTAQLSPVASRVKAHKDLFEVFNKRFSEADGLGDRREFVLGDGAAGPKAVLLSDCFLLPMEADGREFPPKC
jgi:hypothetical protein